MSRLAIVLAIGFIDASWLATAERAQEPATGTVQGTIFWDEDRDGEHDEGEAPLNLSAALIGQEGGVVATAPPSRDGSYSITYAAGPYFIKPRVPSSTGGCADAIRGTFGPFSLSFCFSTPVPWEAAAPGGPFNLEAGETVTIDLPVIVRDQMVLSLRAVFEDGYPEPGDVVTAIVNGQECGEASWQASPGTSREGEAALLVAGNGEVEGCAAQGDPITFVMNGVAALNTPIPYERFDPLREDFPDFFHVHTARLAFLSEWAWFWSDDVHAFDGGTISVDTIVAVLVNGRECGLGRRHIGLLSSDPSNTLYGFGPILIGSTNVEGGCAHPGDRVEFRINQPDAELIATAEWQPGLTPLTGIVIEQPPRPAGDPPPMVMAQPDRPAFVVE